MALKKKLRAKVKATGNSMLESSPNLLRTNTHKGCSDVLNTMDYNYILRSVIRRDNYSVVKWSWFDQQVRNTLLCSRMISRKLVNHTKIGMAIGRLLDMICTICFHEEEYWIYIIILPYIESGKPWIR